MKRKYSIYPLLFLLQLAIVAAFAVPSIERSADLIGLRRHISVNLVNPANSGRLYFYQPALTADVNVPTKLNVQLDTGGVNINSVGMDITYPADKVSVSSFDLSQSFCTLIVTNVIDQTQGVISLSCGTPTPGLRTQIGTVGSILYTPKTTGPITFHIEPTSAQVLKNDGDGTNIIRSTEDVTITVGEPAKATAKPTPTPASTPSPTPTPVSTPLPLQQVPLTSTTHPASTVCSDKKEVSFAWIKEKGVESFEYEFNSSATDFAQPKTTTATSLTVPTLPNSTLTFHLRAVRGTERSPQSTMVIKTCPTPNSISATPRSIQVQPTTKKPGIIQSVIQKTISRLASFWKL